jgi:hypothetical protein
MSFKSHKSNGYFTWRHFHIMTFSRQFLFIMRNVSSKNYRENQNTRFIFSNIFRKSCRLWNNVAKYDGARETVDNMATHIACWINTVTRANTHVRVCALTHTHTHTHTQVCIIITAYKRQHWFCECASLLTVYVHRLFRWICFGGVLWEINRESDRESSVSHNVEDPSLRIRNAPIL